MPFKEGNIPWNKGKKGLFKHTEEHKQKMRELGKKRDMSCLQKNRPASWNKGKTGVYSKETLKKMSAAMMGNKKWLGKHHTEETREKMREAGKKRDVSHLQKYPHITWNKGKTGIYSEEFIEGKRLQMMGNKIWLGRKHTEDECRKIGEANKGRVVTKETREKLSKINSGEKHPFWGKHHSEETKRKMCIARLNGISIPIEDTTIELILQRGLTNHGLRYEKHVPVCNICRPDVVFPELKVVVFADGDYWHSKEFNNGKTWRRDKKNNKILIEGGWRVLRFWEHEINSNPEKCINKIIKTIEERK